MVALGGDAVEPAILQPPLSVEEDEDVAGNPHPSATTEAWAPWWRPRDPTTRTGSVQQDELHRALARRGPGPQEVDP
jgi:hypothetical protein